MKKNGTQFDNTFCLDGMNALDILNKTNKEKTFNDKLQMLLFLGKKAGYRKLTDKQIVIAYYGKYTTKDSTDQKTLKEIREGLSKVKSPFKELIDFNG